LFGTGKLVRLPRAATCGWWTRTATACSPKSIDLTDAFEAGTIQDLLIALSQGGRIAAQEATRNEDGTTLL
jgi:hypothetical protein